MGVFGKGLFSGGTKGKGGGKLLGTILGGGVAKFKGSRGRIRQRNQKRKEANQNRASLGGSTEAQKKLYEDAQSHNDDSRQGYKEDRGVAQKALSTTQERERMANSQYGSDRTSYQNRAGEAVDSIDGITTGGADAQSSLQMGQSGANQEYTAGATQANSTRDNALATGSLAGTANGLLAQRAATIAAAPTIQQANEANIAANTVNAGNQQASSSQMLNRQAMGLAAGQGEGGALAMQQALASAGAASGDMAGASNLQLQQDNAAARYQAAMAQNAQTVDTANLGLSTGMDAASQERVNQLNVAQANAASLEGAAGNRATSGLATAGAQAGVQFQTATTVQAARAAAAAQAQQNLALSSGRDTSLIGAANGQASQNMSTSAANSDSDKQFQSTILTQGAEAQKAAAAAKGRSLLAKVAMPFGILGK